MQQRTLALALIVGGLALAVMSGLRLLRRGFPAMPMPVAGASLVIGLAVVAFGLLLPRTGADSSAAPTPGPRVALEPVDEDEPIGQREDIHGIVTAPDQEPIEGVRVDLVRFAHDEGFAAPSTVSRSDGSFTFKDVNVSPGSPVVAEAIHDETRFPSTVLRAGTTKTSPVALTVADTTKDPGDITLSVESVALVGDKQGMQAVHAASVKNDGKNAFIGPLRLPLLPGANAIDPRVGLDRRMVGIDDSDLLSTAPVLPGTHEITYTYIAPMPSRGIAIDRRVRYPTSRFDLLVGGELEASAPAFDAGNEGVTLGAGDAARSYRRFSIADLEPGDRVEARITPAAGSRVTRIVAVAVAVALAIAILVVPVLLRRRRTTLADDVPA